MKIPIFLLAALFAQAAAAESVYRPAAVWRGHTNAAYSVLFLPDGKRALSSSEDYTLRLWDIGTGRTLSVWKGHTGEVLTLALDSSGAAAYSAGEDRIIRRWDVASGKTTDAWTAHEDQIRALALSPDGKILASNAFDGTIRLWDTKTKKRIGQIHAGVSPQALCIAFSPDGKTLLFGQWDKTLRLYDLKKRAVTRTWTGHRAPVLAAAFSPDGNYVLSGAQDNTALLWDAQSGKALQTLIGHDSYIYSLAFSPDSRTAFTGGADFTIKEWDAATGTLRATRRGHQSHVRDLDVSPDGALLVSASEDHTLRIWDINDSAPARSGSPELTIAEHLSGPGTEKERLGRLLFFDQRLSGDNSRSCSVCHDPAKAYTDGRALSIGAPETLHFRNVPTLLNAGRRKQYYWDGRFSGDDLTSVVRDHISEAHFMNADGRLVVEKLRQIPVYAAGFEQVYGRTPSYSDLLDALAAYTASLAGPDSPEDRFARGDTTALSQEALRGRGLFFGAAGCAACHAGPDFTDDKMHVRNVPENPAVFQEALRRISIRRFFKLFGVNGYADIKEDVGHYAISKDPGDRRAFKTPPLREVSRTAPYMHNGIFSTLEQAVAFEAPKLSSNKRRALVSYLEHLSGPAPENPEAPPLPEYALIDPPEPKPAAFPKASAQAPPGGYPPLGLLPPVPVPEDNPLTPEKIELGKFLFFDPRMSGNGDTFCGACHEPSMGWGDGSSLSLGYSGNPHWRNSQTLLNAAYFANLDWDGDKSSLEDQARSATTSNTSGNADPAMVEERLADSPRYVQMFRKAFGIGRPTFDAALKAVASFVRSVPISKGSPFDSFERGDAGALSDSALRGRRLFEGKAGCIACHNGPLASDQNFHRTGVAPHPAFLQQPLRQAALRYQHILRGVPEQIYAGASEDTGLFLVTLRDEDKGKFRTPSLRELSHTAPYMHNGTLRTLKDVVDFYDRGGGPVEDKSPLLKPLSLTPNEKEDLIAFLKSLSGPEIDVTYPDLPGDY